MEQINKTLIWIVGKPGSGKTTLGQALTQSKEGAIHYSYGQLLKDVQPNYSPGGYSIEDRLKADEIIVTASESHSIVVVDSQVGFGLIERIKHAFDCVRVIHLRISDEEALSRLVERNREVLAHDGTSEEDRIRDFNERQAPIISEYKNQFKVSEIDVSEGATVQEVVMLILDAINT